MQCHNHEWRRNGNFGGNGSRVGTYTDRTVEWLKINQYVHQWRERKNRTEEFNDLVEDTTHRILEVKSLFSSSGDLNSRMVWNKDKDAHSIWADGADRMSRNGEIMIAFWTINDMKIRSKFWNQLKENYSYLWGKEGTRKYYSQCCV